MGPGDPSQEPKICRSASVSVHPPELPSVHGRATFHVHPPEPTNMAAALRGIKVLDLSRLLPGPYATQILADMGATVIKVENAASGGNATITGARRACTLSAAHR